MDERKTVDAIVKDWENLHIVWLEYPNVPFAETVAFEVIPEDFDWDRWGAEHRFIHLCRLK
jgi:hypothetical protein